MRTRQLARVCPTRGIPAMGGFSRQSVHVGSLPAAATFALVLAVALAGCRPTTDTSAGPGDHRTEPEGEAPAQVGAPAPADDASGTAGAPGDPAEADESADEPRGEGGDSGARELLVDEDHDQYAHVEGTGFENSCETDADCFAGGCSSEICSAEQDVSSPCIMPAEGWASQGGSCGCVEGTCSWYRASADSGSGDGSSSEENEPTPGRSPQALEGQGEACKGGECPGPLTCVKYYGVAGPQGPEFSSCEIPCPQGEDACPEGQTCVTIADGPGQVCRARPGR